MNLIDLTDISSTETTAGSCGSACGCAAEAPAAEAPINVEQAVATPAASLADEPSSCCG